MPKKSSNQVRLQGNHNDQPEIKKPKYNRVTKKMVHEDYFEGGGDQDPYDGSHKVKDING